MRGLLAAPSVSHVAVPRPADINMPMSQYGTEGPAEEFSRLVCQRIRRPPPDGPLHPLAQLSQAVQLVRQVEVFVEVPRLVSQILWTKDSYFYALESQECLYLRSTTRGVTQGSTWGLLKTTPNRLHDVRMR